MREDRSTFCICSAAMTPWAACRVETVKALKFWVLLVLQPPKGESPASAACSASSAHGFGFAALGFFLSVVSGLGPTTKPAVSSSEALLASSPSLAQVALLRQAEHVVGRAAGEGASHHTRSTSCCKPSNPCIPFKHPIPFTKG